MVDDEVTPTYSVLLLDPPWQERGGGRIKRGADRHYSVMSTARIETLLVDEWRIPERMLDPSVCFMWVTNNFLIDGLRVMNAMGFRYVTNLVWTKDRFGLGYYFRGQHELCLFGVRGKWGRPRGTSSTLLGGGLLPRRKHSQKPDEMAEMIEDRFDGPYLELFARREREGWDCWGDQLQGNIDDR
jgi:N6-adenosine-specific RNA methylase IME4